MMNISTSGSIWSCRRSVSVRLLAMTCVMMASAAMAEGAPDPGRVTTRFELAQIRSLLQGIAKLCTAGFTRDEAQQLAAGINALKTEKPQVWEFSATCKAQPRQLRVRALVDELSEVDLDFSTDPEFAAQIRQVVGARQRNKP
jgi:hypothetical protein